MTTKTINSTAQAIRSLLRHNYALSVYSKYAPYTLSAEVAELNVESGQLVLEAECPGDNIEQYLRNGSLSFDIEALKAPAPFQRKTYSISNVAAKVLKTDSTTYRLECQLPESAFSTESRGAIRIPFIMGMRARVSIEAYQHELSIPGVLCNLSAGGCLVEISLADSIAITTDQIVPGVTLEFPNGESFFAEGRIRHMRPFGKHGYAAVGIQFINMTSAQSKILFHYVSEAEHEATYRSGVSQKVNRPSSLFIPSAKEKRILLREEQEQLQRGRQTPMQKGVLEVAHQLQVGLMHIKTRQLFPEEVFYDCCDTLLHLVAQDRKAFLYALSLLRDEPDWVRHAVKVAGRLADMMRMRDPHSTQIREAVLGALLHTMGKPLLVSEALPSLKAHMTPSQKEILKGHVVAFRNKLKDLGWTPSPTCRDILENANERLDGSGYPSGKQGSELSETVRLISVIKMVNKLTHERNGIPPRTPLDAYRWINEAAESFDKAILVEYIQHHGLYPIGSLAKFSGGFLAWIMDTDAKGMPVKVNVIKNLAFKDTFINNVLTSSDFAQIGKLEGVVNPADYGIRLSKL